MGSTWDIQHQVSKLEHSAPPDQPRSVAPPLAPTQEAAVSRGSWLGGVRGMLQEMQAHGSRTWAGEVG